MPHWRRLILPVLWWSIFVAPAALAGENPAKVQSDLRTLAHATSSTPVPPEWSGVWTVTDTIYDCLGSVQSTPPPESDTLCTGAEVVPPGQNDYSCTGTADATTYSIACTGTSELFPNCNGNFTLETHGTRTGDDYFSVTVIQVIYSGSDPSCSLIPPSCNQINSHGHRTDVAPADFCSTPVTGRTWGQVKVLYR